MKENSQYDADYYQKMKLRSYLLAECIIFLNTKLYLINFLKAYVDLK